VRAIKKNNPEAVITLMMPEHMDDPDAIIDAVRAGARSFIKKHKMDAETKRRLDYILRKREVKNDAGRDQHADNRGNG
jgi:DNA-binding NarL/FixJ family response regulator